MVWQDKVIENRDGKKYGQLFVPQRTQPPHIGHISMLEAVCRSAREVVIGIGSSNVINSSNPYYSVEREMMIRKSLDDVGVSNYRFIHMPDFNDDSDWLNYVLDNADLKNGAKVVSGNSWVEEVFSQNGYSSIKPEEIIEHELIDISATKLREMIVSGDENWKNYAASGTKHYFERFGGRTRIAKFF